MRRLRPVKHLQIRNVPEDLHRELKVRAAREGRSLSEYALAQLRRSLERPERAEVLARIRGRGPVELPTSADELVRAERDSR